MHFTATPGKPSGRLSTQTPTHMFRYAALIDPATSDHCSVASQAKSIAKTTNPVAAEIMKERSNQSI